MKNVGKNKSVAFIILFGVCVYIYIGMDGWMDGYSYLARIIITMIVIMFPQKRKKWNLEIEMFFTVIIIREVY